MDAASELTEDIFWDQFLTFFHKNWKQGEHVTLVAPTGQGKTTIALEILPIRKYVCVYVTKAKDDVLFPGLKSQGFQEVKDWTPNPDHQPKVMLRPAPQDTSIKEERRERAAFQKGLDYAFKAGGWAIDFDELKYITDDLNLKREVNKLYLQGRSLGVSLIGTSQRPAWIPLVALNQATHLFIGPLSDQVDIDRAASVAGKKALTVRAVVPELDEFEYLYIHTRKPKVPAYKVKVNR